LPINIYDSPVADFSASNVCQGININFNNLTTAPQHGTIGNFWWDFGDNSPLNTTNWNPNYLYNASGIFQVSLIVQNSQWACYDTITKPVRVYANPSAGFSYAEVCFGNTMNFTDSSSVATTDTITSYLWTFGDGSPTNNTQNPSHLYNNPGAYTATLIVTSTGGCSDVQTHTVNVYDAPQANFTTSNVCLNTVATFNNTTQNPQHGSLGNFSWNFGDGSPLDTTHWNSSHQYNSHGTYQVTLITQNANLGCADTITIPIVIHPMPVPDFTFVNQCQADAYTFNNSSSVVQGSIVSYNWNFGDNNTSISSSPSHLYNAPGNYNVTLTATTDSGCVLSITKQVTVYPMPDANFTVNEVCHNSPTQFTSTSTVLPPDNITNYQWAFGDNNSSVLQNPQHTYNTPGLFNATLIVTTNHGCKDTITLPVTVHPNPVVNFTADKLSGCSPLCITLTSQSNVATGNISQLIWTMEDGSSFNGSPVNICFTNSSVSNPNYETITLTAITDQGCTRFLEKQDYITIYPKPIAEFYPNPDELVLYETASTMINLSQGANQWNWEMGDGTTYNYFQPTHVYTDTGTYFITLTVSNQWGCLDTTVRQIIIKPGMAIYVPNTFTPNGDKLNDFFTAEGFGIKEFTMEIFDRWGLKLFETMKMDIGWDGTYGGKECQIDVYVYQITAIDIFNKKHTYRGQVNLIR